MRISDWRSDVCASDLVVDRQREIGEIDQPGIEAAFGLGEGVEPAADCRADPARTRAGNDDVQTHWTSSRCLRPGADGPGSGQADTATGRLPSPYLPGAGWPSDFASRQSRDPDLRLQTIDRKSTRLNSSH